MYCRTIEKQILAFIKNELPSEIRTEFEEHLKNCPECTELVQKFVSVWRYVEAPKKVNATPYFWAGVQQRLNEQKSWVNLLVDFSGRIAQSTRPVLAAMTVAVGLYLGYLLGNLKTADFQTVIASPASESSVATYFNSSYITTFKSIPNTSFETVYLNMIYEEKEEK